MICGCGHTIGQHVPICRDCICGRVWGLPGTPTTGYRDTPVQPRPRWLQRAGAKDFTGAMRPLG